MTEVQIKLSAEQHKYLLARLGSDEAIREYIQAYIAAESQKELLNASA